MIGMIDSVTRVQGRLKGAFAEARSSTGLAEMEMTVLNAVVEAERPPTVPQIGRSLGHPRQVIQRATNQLVSAELIVAIANPDHKRAPLLVPTAKGRGLKKAADVRGAAIASDLLRSVDRELVVEATELLEKIRHQLESHVRSATAEHSKKGR